MIQVYFKKSPTGSPFFLAYNAGQWGVVRPQLVEGLVKAGIIDQPKRAELIDPSEDFTPAVVLEQKAMPKKLDLSTEEGVRERYGDDVQAMKAYCDEHGLVYSNAAKTPKYFWAKIAAGK